MSDNPDPLAPLLFTPRVLWFALFMSNILVFSVVAAVVVPPDEPFDMLMLYVLAAAAVGAGVAQVIIPRRVEAGLLAAAKADTEERADPNASVIFREAAPTVRYFADPPAAAKTAAALFHTPFILRVALSESIGMYGAVLVALGCPLEQAIAFPLIAAVLIARLFPTRKSVMAPLEGHFGARMPEPGR